MKAEQTKADKAYRAAWEKLFAELPEDQQRTILAVPDGMDSAKLAIRAEKLVEQSGAYNHES